MNHLQGDFLGRRILRVRPSGKWNVNDLGRHAVDIGNRGKGTLAGGAEFVEVRDGCIEVVQVLAGAGLEVPFVKGPIALDSVQHPALGRGLAGRERILAHDRGGGAVVELELDRLERIGAELKRGLVGDGGHLSHLGHGSARQSHQAAIDRELDAGRIHCGAVVSDPQFDFRPGADADLTRFRVGIAEIGSGAEADIARRINLDAAGCGPIVQQNFVSHGIHVPHLEVRRRNAFRVQNPDGINPGRLHDHRGLDPAQRAVGQPERRDVAGIAPHGNSQAVIRDSADDVNAGLQIKIADGFQRKVIIAALSSRNAREGSIAGDVTRSIANLLKIDQFRIEGAVNVGAAQVGDVGAQQAGELLLGPLRRGTALRLVGLMDAQPETAVVGIHAPGGRCGRSRNRRGIDHGEGVAERFRAVGQIHGVG